MAGRVIRLPVAEPLEVALAAIVSLQRAHQAHHGRETVARNSSRLRLAEKSASTPRSGTGATGARDERGSHTPSPAPPDGYLGVMVRGVDVGEVVDGGTVAP
jgi:hypothetical protein